MSKETLFKALPVIILSSLLVVAIIYAWTEPTAAPPGGNVSAPLNVGPTGQEKAGGLILNTGGAVTGLIVAQGNVGIGTTTPSQKLDIVGALRLQPISAPTAANGVIYYSSSENKFKCYQSGSWTDCIGAGAGTNYWTQSGSSLYPNDTAWNVGIGTTAPAYKLDVNGDLIANWLRTRGNTGWYSESYGGGWYMLDTTWIRAYNDKYVYTGGVSRADAGFQVDGYEMVGSNADMLYANRRNTTGGGIWIADDGGFYDYNNGFVDFRGSTGIRVLEGDGSWGDNSIRATYLCMQDNCRNVWPLWDCTTVRSGLVTSTVTVNCPGGHAILSGGFERTGSNTNPVESYPSGNGWRCGGTVTYTQPQGYCYARCCR